MPVILWVSPEQYEQLAKKRPNTIRGFTDIVDPEGKSNYHTIWPILGMSSGNQLEVRAHLHSAQNPENKPALTLTINTGAVIEEGDFFIIPNEDAPADTSTPTHERFSIWKEMRRIFGQ